MHLSQPAPKPASSISSKTNSSNDFIPVTKEATSVSWTFQAGVFADSEQTRARNGAGEGDSEQDAGLRGTKVGPAAYLKSVTLALFSTDRKGSTADCTFELEETNANSTSYGDVIESIDFADVQFSNAADGNLYKFDGWSAPLVRGDYYSLDLVCTLTSGTDAYYKYNADAAIEIEDIEKREYANAEFEDVDVDHATAHPAGFRHSKSRGHPTHSHRPRCRPHPHWYVFRLEPAERSHAFLSRLLFLYPLYSSS